MRIALNVDQPEIVQTLGTAVKKGSKSKSPCLQEQDFDLTALRRVHGLVAQLEERRNGIAEVVSSILIGSTNLKATPQGVAFLFIWHCAACA